MASMTSIMRSMTSAKAMHILKTHKLATPALTQVVDTALAGNSNLRKQRMGDGRRRAVLNVPTGYSALAGAKHMLNIMIFNGSSKYDVEIAACTEFYAKQCASLEVCR